MSTGNGKVVVNRSMSLDGFSAGPGHTMNWIFIGRRTYEVAKRMRDADCGSGLSTRSQVHVLAVLFGDGIGFSFPGLLG